MLNINPTLYRICCSSCGGLTVLPLDILQTRVLTNKPVTLKLSELKWLGLFCFLFAMQNTVYSRTSFIQSKNIRGTLAAISVAPFSIFLKVKIFYSRLNLLPVYDRYIFWTITRDIVCYNIIYSLYLLNIPYAKFLTAFLANLLTYPIKIMAMKRGYPTLNINIRQMRLSALLEIIKTAISDGTTLFLIYNFKYSPIKINNL